jgi:hypothetical protein
MQISCAAIKLRQYERRQQIAAPLQRFTVAEGQHCRPAA